MLSALTALSLMYFLRFGNPLIWGFFPFVWLSFIIWLLIGSVFYFAYGRHKSTVALQDIDRLAVRQPPVTRGGRSNSKRVVAGRRISVPRLRSNPLRCRRCSASERFRRR